LYFLGIQNTFKLFYINFHKWILDVKSKLCFVQTKLYTEDWIGLRTLDEAGKVKFFNLSGDHLDITHSDMKTYIVPYLKDHNHIVPYLKDHNHIAPFLKDQMKESWFQPWKIVWSAEIKCIFLVLALIIIVDNSINNRW
jgi:hypothetical protein